MGFYSQCEQALPYAVPAHLGLALCLSLRDYNTLQFLKREVNLTVCDVALLCTAFCVPQRACFTLTEALCSPCCQRRAVLTPEPIPFLFCDLSSP